MFSIGWFVVLVAHLLILCMVFLKATCIEWRRDATTSPGDLSKYHRETLMEFATNQHINWPLNSDALHAKLTKKNVAVDRLDEIDELKELLRIPRIHEWP